MSEIIKLPVTATMAKQSNGEYILATAEYAEISVDDFAVWLLGKLGVERQ